MITTGEDLRSARQRLGWSTDDLARALRLRGDRSSRRSSIEKMERGDKEITGPVAVAVEGFLQGHRPAD